MKTRKKWTKKQKSGIIYVQSFKEVYQYGNESGKFRQAYA